MSTAVTQRIGGLVAAQRLWLLATVSRVGNQFLRGDQASRIGDPVDAIEPRGDGGDGRDAIGPGNPQECGPSGADLVRGAGENRPREALDLRAMFHRMIAPVGGFNRGDVDLVAALTEPR